MMPGFSIGLDKMATVGHRVFQLGARQTDILQHPVIEFTEYGKRTAAFLKLAEGGKQIAE